jgi:hypothetical protein
MVPDGWADMQFRGEFSPVIGRTIRHNSGAAAFDANVRGNAYRCQ